MKTFFALAALAVAAVNAETCELTKLTPLASDPNATKCTADSGYTFLPPSKPTADVLPKVCASSACQAVLTTVAGLGLGDCTVVGLALQTDLIDAFKTGCASLAGGAGSSSAVGSTAAGDSSKAVEVTTAPAASSAASTTGSTTGSTSGTAGASATVTTAPTPSPTSGASSVAVATGAVALAVAGAFM
uniref:Elicitin n=1 Tax=Globisporangium ultimum (strain ATCC 200006 / CBS 805.95 / DAOM BR144) TaxID=431595 RepID=K3WD17_GLOUD